MPVAVSNSDMNALSLSRNSSQWDGDLRVSGTSILYFLQLIKRFLLSGDGFFW